MSKYKPIKPQNNTSSKKEYPPLDLTDEFKFGKHKGETVEEILGYEPTYIKWAISEGIKFTNEAYKAYEDAISDWEIEHDIDHY